MSFWGSAHVGNSRRQDSYLRRFHFSTSWFLTSCTHCRALSSEIYVHFLCYWEEVRADLSYWLHTFALFVAFFVPLRSTALSLEGYFMIFKYSKIYIMYKSCWTGGLRSGRIMRRHLYEWPLNSCQQQLRTTMLTFSSGQGEGNNLEHSVCIILCTHFAIGHCRRTLRQTLRLHFWRQESNICQQGDASNTWRLLEC